MALPLRAGFRRVGRYDIRPLTGGDSTDLIVYDGYTTHPPERRVRVKAYLKQFVELGTMSHMIKTQEELQVVRTQLLNLAEKLGTEGGSALLDSPATPIENHITRVVLTGTNRDLLFLQRCSEHVLLNSDKMQSQSKVFLIREWVDDTVRGIVQYGRLGEDMAFYYLYQLLQGVFFLHSNGLTHCHITAEHLYLSRGATMLQLGGMGRCVAGQTTPDPQRHIPAAGLYGTCSSCNRYVPIQLPDAGPAVPAEVPPLNALFMSCPHCGLPQSMIHVMQTMVGSPDYTPREVLLAQQQPIIRPATGPNPSPPPPPTPEVNGSPQLSELLGRPTSPITDGQASDMWSCGVVLFYLLTGTLPFGPTPASGEVPDSERVVRMYEVLRQIMQVRYTIPSYLSPHAHILIRALLNPDPHQRPTALDLLQLPLLNVHHGTHT